MTANFTEVTYEKSKVAKLRKRIFLPADLQQEVHEERHVIECKNLNSYLASYNYKSGWSVIWLDLRMFCLQAEYLEVIKRRHRLGNFILFRVWKTDQKSKGAGE